MAILIDMNFPLFLEQDRDITELSGYHTKTKAQFFLEIKNEDDIPKLHETYGFALVNNLPFLIISGGTNLLFARESYDGVIVKNSLSGWGYSKKDKILRAFSDSSIWEIAEKLEDSHDNPLWHRFIGLPGSIGGAVYGNAGCFGLETESNFLSATVYNMLTGSTETLPKDEMGFAYRHSMLKDNPHLFLVSACFDLGEKREKYHSDVDNIYFREHKQPKGFSCGSFFKNPSKEISAGFLIESVGLKGYHHGGAYWSDLHANFLMSDGDACTGQDLLSLVRLTQEKVEQEHGIKLVNEVKIVE